jgi:hypothetical protein
MNCRKTLDAANLEDSFGTTAAVKLFENKRRAALVLADSAHDLVTMTKLMPVVHELDVAVADFRKATEILHDKEQSVRSKQLHAHNLAMGHMRAADKLAVGPLKHARKDLIEAASNARQYARTVGTIYGGAQLTALRSPCSVALPGHSVRRRPPPWPARHGLLKEDARTRRTGALLSHSLSQKPGRQRQRPWSTPRVPAHFSSIVFIFAP